MLSCPYVLAFGFEEPAFTPRVFGTVPPQQMVVPHHSTRCPFSAHIVQTESQGWAAGSPTSGSAAAQQLAFRYEDLQLVLACYPRWQVGGKCSPSPGTAAL